MNCSGEATPAAAPGSGAVTATPRTSKVSLAPAGSRAGLPKKNGSMSASNTSLSSAALVSLSYFNSLKH